MPRNESFAHGFQKAAAHGVLRKEGLDQRGFNEFVAVGLERAAQAAATQFDGGGVGGHFGLVVSHRVFAAAAALEHQGTVGIIGREEFGHGVPR